LNFCRRCKLMETLMIQRDRSLRPVCICCDPVFQTGGLDDCHHEEKPA